MEVLRLSSVGLRTSYLGGEKYWATDASSSSSHFTTHHHSLPSFGPQPPPSSPYYDDMSRGSERLTLPPISDLLALSRNDSKPSERRSDLPRGTDSPMQGHNHLRQHHHRQSSSTQTSPTSRQISSPTGSSSSSFAAAREMQPPLILQPTPSISRIDPALFNESRHRQTAQSSPTAASRPTLDTSSLYSSRQSIASPYPNSAPVRSHYAELSPRSAVSSAPYYNPPRYEQHRHTLPTPGAPPTPRTLTSDSPLLPQTLPSLSAATPQQQQQRYVHEDASNPQQRSILPQFGAASATSPKIDRTLPSVTLTGFHPYSQHTRGDSQASVESRTFAPPSPSSRHSQPTGQSSPASGLQDRYQCPTCAKAFSRPSSLRIHSHSHTGEKPFVCPRHGCGKAFSVRSNMKRHERGCHVGLGVSITSDPRREPPAEEDELL